jgi:thermostable 8-oxoguanine DNA glycosylase
MGSSRGYVGLMQNEANYSKVVFSALQKVSPRWRREHIARVFRDAGVRYAERKAGWLAENMKVVKELGGLDSVKEKLEGAYRMSGKIALLMTFKGISKKYARNIMMDVFHPEFQDCIAVDARIKSITKALGLKFSTYEEEERFYIDSAKAARLQPWELDRVLYNFTRDVIDAL